MKRRLALIYGALAIPIFVVAACGSVGESYEPRMRSISIYHDDERQVTCWVYSSAGISCLPDSQLAGVILNEPLVSP